VEIAEQEHKDHSEQMRELLQRLDDADVDPNLTDFLETDNIAQVVVGRLLDTIDSLREDLEKAKWAQRDTETRVIWATHKCQASPTIKGMGETPQPKHQCKGNNGGGPSAPPLETPTPPIESGRRPQQVPETLGTGNASRTGRRGSVYTVHRT
jgi:hypothetical protein